MICDTSAPVAPLRTLRFAGGGGSFFAGGGSCANSARAVATSDAVRQRMPLSYIRLGLLEDLQSFGRDTLFHRAIDLAADRLGQCVEGFAVDHVAERVAEQARLEIELAQGAALRKSARERRDGLDRLAQRSFAGEGHVVDGFSDRGVDRSARAREPFQASEQV